jgi:sulfur carrier protein
MLLPDLRCLLRMANDTSITIGDGREATGLELQLVVNGEPTTTRAANLAELIEQAGYGARVATALNGNFVPARARATTMLQAGDHVEIVAPRQGG